jgi:hypothetical protein
MSSIQKASYIIADSQFYEPLERYQPEPSAHLDPVKEMLPKDWMVIQKGPWFHAVPPDKILPLQGWKIHLSASEKDARSIIDCAVPVLVDGSTPFKFAVDRRMLSIMNSRSWGRGAAGKFITIYPDNEDDFRRLLEQLDQATAGLSGPYIYTDRRYKNSRVVQYRYGGITPTGVLTLKGDRQFVLVSPTGETVPDERQPCFVLPDWVSDPFPEEASELQAGEEHTLHDGRYLIESVLTFSNCGGVYLATDRQTGSTVLIKEARPLVNTTPSGDDAVALLHKEYRLLQKLENTGIAPHPLDFFQDWEHFYLVEEYLENAKSLRSHAAANDVLLLTNPSREDVEACWADFRRVFSRVTEILTILHAHGVVFMDLSLNNVLVVQEGAEMKLIDFEAAFEIGLDSPTYIFTPGFASLDDMNTRKQGVEGDYYALGAMMLAYFMPVNGLSGLDRHVHERFIESVTEDFALPKALASTVIALMDRDPDRRPGPAEVISMLETNAGIERAPAIQIADEAAVSGYHLLLDRVVDYILGVASYDRSDRLFPADPKVFVTNPLGLGYGACGTAYAIHALRGRVPQEVLDWILRQDIDPQRYTPGLYCGLAGIAWVLLDLGIRDRAEKLLHASFDHPSLPGAADMFYGLAGWGLTNLKFFLSTGDQAYLDQARKAGEQLIATGQEGNDGLYWPSPDGSVWLGFGHGGSGVSLFLLYLYLTTGEQRFLDCGRKALDFDLDNSMRNREGGLSWRLRTGPITSMVPYFRYGAAGVGTAVLRYYWLLGGERYRAVLDDILPDVDRKYAIFPGKFMGLAGMGDFLLDLAETEGYERRARDAARRVATGVTLFQLERPEGIAFPGYDLFRITCDYGSGSAGIALFLNRLLTGRQADFLLDTLFQDETKRCKNVVNSDTYRPALALAIA